MDTPSQAFIYLDHNGTTPVDPSAREAMMPFMHESFGNPSSSYILGVKARESLENARTQVASLLRATEQDIIFTSGGSESNNMVLKGVVDFRRAADFHIITSAVEHPAILEPSLFLMEMGVRVTILPVDHYGQVDPDDVRKAIRPRTTLISIMMANNETGTLQAMAAISEISRQYEIPLHTDAAQAVGKIAVDVRRPGVDYLTVAGHKLYGPKGVGALFVGSGKHLTPLIHGAGQEHGMRAGTENVMLSVGLGAACKTSEGRLHEDMKAMKAMRDRLQDLLFRDIDGLVLNGHPVERLPNTLSISVPGIEGGKILEGLPRLMASTGAACHDRSVSLSHVLSAMAVPPEIGMGTIRLTVGRTNTMDQIEEAGHMIIERVKELRDMRV